MSWPALIAPLGLFGGIALAAITLIHMRHRVPPSASVPSIRFWAPAPRDHAERRRLRKPPITLPFLLQLAAAALITLGLARPLAEPLLGADGRGLQPEHVIVLLDGSTSMQARVSLDKETTRWDVARDRVVGVLDDWRAGDVVTVMTMGARLDTTSASSAYQRDTLRDGLRQTAAPGGRADLNDALTVAQDLVLPDRDNRVVVISDGALTVNPATAQQVQAPIELLNVGVDTDASNVAITSLKSRSIIGSANQFRISFAVASFGDEAVRVPYVVAADGVEVVTGTLALNPAQTRTFEVNLPPDAKAVSVNVQSADVFTADNMASLDLAGAELGTNRILLISDLPGALAKALAVIPGATVDTFDSSTPGIHDLAAGYDLVVFEGTTPRPDDIPVTPMMFIKPQSLGGEFASQGVMPAPGVREVKVGDPMLAGVDFNGVTFGETPIYTLSPSDVSLVSGSDTSSAGPLVWRGVLGDQPYVALGFAITTSNLGDRVAFPILVRRIVESLTTSNVPVTIPLGEPLVFTPGVGTTRVIFTNPLGHESVIRVDGRASSGTSDVTYPETGIAGAYTVEQTSADGRAASEGSFIVNAGQADESNLAVRDSLVDDLQGGDHVEATRSTANRRAEIWPPLVTGALLLVVAEWFASQRRVRSRQSIGTSASRGAAT